MGLASLLRENIGMLVIFLLLMATSGCLADDEVYHLVSQNKGQYDHVTWSPNGDAILVELEEQFATLNLDGTDERILPISLDGRSGPNTLHWLSENQIAYSLSFREESGSRISNLMTYDLDQNSEQMLLSTERILKACWSEVEQVFVLVLWIPADSESHVYGNALSIYDPKSRDLSPLFRVSRDGAIRNIACGVHDGLVAVVEREGEPGKGTHRLLAISIRSQSKQTLYEGSRFWFDSPTWSPDGKWIAVISIHGTADTPLFGIMLIATDGSENRTVMESNLTITPTELSWSPVENLLLVRSKDGFRKYSLYSLDLTPWLNDENVDD